MVNLTNQVSDFGHIRVADCMHHGIFSCAGDAPLARVATIMSEQQVNAVVVTNSDGGRPVGVVSDLDVVAAAAAGSDPAALQAAATEPLTVSADESLHRAAQLMSEHGVAHLVVVDAAGGYPVGVLSTLDVVAVYAGATSSG
jgi:predicted transcriptional regulator